MSSELPPTDYFTGISFNPDFYQSTSSDYLTASTGKSYFLSYPTAQGTETITTLKSSSIDSSSTTTNMAIASAQTSGALNIASLPSRTGNINIGYSTSAPSGLGYNINMGNILSNTSIGGKFIELAAASSGITISTSGTLDMIATAYNMGTSLVNATNINIGTTGKSTTTIYGTLSVNDNLSMGSNKTIFTTSGQQLRLGYANTQTTGTATSSFGPFIKSFGPITTPGTLYDIVFDGTDGMFPTGTDGCGGLLIIYLKNTTAGAKFATFTCSISKRLGTTNFGALQIINTNALGWTAAPTLVAGTGNNIRISINAADVSGTTISWMLMGCI
jgi:hypothetical protein